MSEFFEDLKFDAKQPAAKRALWLTWTVALIALTLTICERRARKTLAREQLKNQYMLAALCNMPENKFECVKGFKNFENDKD